MTNPFWIEDPELKKGEVDFLSSAETQFWKDLIDKYLFPIDQDKDEQVRCETQLDFNGSVFENSEDLISFSGFSLLKLIKSSQFLKNLKPLNSVNKFN